MKKSKKSDYQKYIEKEIKKGNISYPLTSRKERWGY